MLRFRNNIKISNNNETAFLKDLEFSSRDENPVNGNLLVKNSVIKTASGK